MQHYFIFVFLLVCVVKFGNTQSQRCLTPDQRQGNCIELRQCTRLYNMIREPNLSIADQNYLRNSECAYRNSYQRWVCCPSDDGQQQSSSDRQPPLDTHRLLPVGPGLTVNDLPQPGVCGSSVDNRITFGEVTAINEYPWMVLIEYTKPNGDKGFHCGGMLINQDYVLTASHCVNGRGLTQLRWVLSGVRLGEWDLSHDRDCDDGNCSDPVLNIPVVERISHENYKPNSRIQEHDIALLRLARSITFTDWIKPICLPISPELAGKNYDGQPLIVAGWGRTENNTNSNIKLKVEVDGVPMSQCNDVYRERNVLLTNKQLCAGGGASGKDSCKGDSGGPLMTKHSPDPYHIYHYLAGLVSFGSWPCGLEGWPGVYTRVDQYTDWIVSHMRV